MKSRPFSLSWIYLVKLRMWHWKILEVHESITVFRSNDLHVVNLENARVQYVINKLNFFPFRKFRLAPKIVFITSAEFWTNKRFEQGPPYRNWRKLRTRFIDDACIFAIHQWNCPFLIYSIVPCSSLLLRPPGQSCVKNLIVPSNGFTWSSRLLQCRFA